MLFNEYKKGLICFNEELANFRNIHIMRLSRSLFYFLILIFASGVVLICLADSSSVWSRIATGLITGSFVGAVNTLVNYLHHRKEFFEKYSQNSMDVVHALRDDFWNAKKRLEYIQTASREEIILRDSKEYELRAKEAKEFHKKYGEFLKELSSDPYAPLFWLKNKRVKLLLELEDVLFNIGASSVDMLDTYAFALLATECSKEEQMLIIGEADEFYERTMQSNVDFRDIMVFNINELATICDNLQKSLKGVVEKHYVTFWQFDSHMLRTVIEGYEIRDVKKERGDELYKAMEEEDNEEND